MKETLTRREFLSLSAVFPAMLALRSDLAQWLPRLAVFSPQGMEPPGGTLIVIFQRGAMDGLNAVIPLGEAEYYRQRPSLAIPEPKPGDDTSAIELDGFFGLHPALRPLKDIWDAGDLAIVHACGSPDPTHSHFDAMDYMERGTPGEKALTSGWLARHLQTAAWENGSPFRAVGIGSMLPTSLRGPVPALALQSIADFHLGGERRSAELLAFQQTLMELYAPVDPALAEPAALTFEATTTLESAIEGAYQPTGGVRYPESGFGRALMQVAQLIKAEIGLEVAAVDIGGWDTHVNQGGSQGQMAALLSDLAEGLAALYADLGEKARRVTIVTMSEFGRRLKENANNGTDHGHGNAMFLLGGGVNGGKVYANWPGLAPEALYGPGDLSVTTDYRDVLSEILAKRMLNDKRSEIFPGYSSWNPLGVVSDLT